MRPNMSADAQRESAPRRALAFRTGRQGGTTLEQAPSGSGPASHAPPKALARAHFHRAPFFLGAHSRAAMHRPLRSGPMPQAFPSAAHPQTHFWVGRS